MTTWTVNNPSPNGLCSLNFRLPKMHLDALTALARKTRVRQSEYLREAIADLLAKYEERSG